MTCDEAMVLSTANCAAKDRGEKETPGSRLSSSIDEAYTLAILRGRHPRSFRNERGIYRYVNDSNRRVTLRQRSRGLEGRRHQRRGFRRSPPKMGNFVSHDHDAHRRQAEFDSINAHPSSDLDSNCDPIRRRSLSPPVGVHFAPSSPPSPEKSNSADDGYHANDVTDHASGSQLLSPSPTRLSTAQSSPQSLGFPSRITPETEELQEEKDKHQQEQRLSRVTFPADGPRLLNNSGELHHQPPQGYMQESHQPYSMRQQRRRRPRKESLQHSREQNRGDSGGAGGVKRSPQTATTLSSFLTNAVCQKSLAAYMLDLRSRQAQMGTGSGVDRDGDGKLGGYVIHHGCLGDQLKGGNVGGVSGGHVCPGGSRQTSLARGGSMGQMVQQQQGRGGDRPLTAHQRFITVIGGVEKEPQMKNEDETHLLDNLNHDPSLRLHYGLHITLQAVQGETDHFMTLDRGTGAVSMRPASGVETRAQQITFKLIDYEDPESCRSILYGRSVWLQVISGPGEPTWKQGSAIGARVRGPGMLPTVEIDSRHKAASWSESGPDTGSDRAASSRPAVRTPENANLNSTEQGTPGGVIASGDCVEGSIPGEGGGEAPEVEGYERRTVLAGGNTDINRPVGMPFPFKAAASSKLGDSIGTTSDTILRMINKSVIMNCRWIVKPVRPDGEAVPSLLGTEVRNMDYVYFEQDFFYISRVNHNASVVLKTLIHKSEPSTASSSGGSDGTRGTGQKDHKAFYPVNRRGVFKLQVAETDELRPGEERSAALMRKAKRGLKRSESRRLGQRTYYVHKRRPGDSLSGGTTFPREIRAQTARFTSESESRAISTASSSSSFLTCPAPLTPTTERMIVTSEDPPWMSTAGLWGSRLLQTMSGGVERGARVAASHAPGLSEWRRRWRRFFSSHRPSTTKGKTSSGGNHSEGNEVSPMCARCDYISRKIQPSDGIDHSISADNSTIGLYRLCSINREVQREVSQSFRTNALSMEGMGVYRPLSLAAKPVSSSGGVVPAKEGESAAVDSAGGARLTSSPPGSSPEIALDSSEKGSRARPSLSPVVAAGPHANQGLLMSKEASSSVLGEPSFSSSVGSSTGSGGVPSSGLKKGRFRRPNRRKNKDDPFQALEEMLMERFSVESITRKLEREDETLQRGVRHLERDMTRLKGRGRLRHSLENLPRSILTTEGRLEAAVSDAPAASLP